MVYPDSHPDWPGALRADWPNIISLVETIETIRVPADKDDHAAMEPWRKEPDNRLDDASIVKNLCLLDIDDLKKIKTIIDQLLRKYLDDESLDSGKRVRLERVTFATVTWPLTRALCIMLGLKPSSGSRDKQTDPNAHRAKTWNRKVWATLFQVATAQNSNLGKRKRREQSLSKQSKTSRTKNSNTKKSKTSGRVKKENSYEISEDVDMNNDSEEPEVEYPKKRTKKVKKAKFVKEESSESEEPEVEYPKKRTKKVKKAKFVKKESSESEEPEVEYPKKRTKKVKKAKFVKKESSDEISDRDDDDMNSESEESEVKRLKKQLSKALKAKHRKKERSYESSDSDEPEVRMVKKRPEGQRLKENYTSDSRASNNSDFPAHASLMRLPDRTRSPSERPQPQRRRIQGGLAAPSWPQHPVTAPKIVYILIYTLDKESGERSDLIMADSTTFRNDGNVGLITHESIRDFGMQDTNMHALQVDWDTLYLRETKDGKKHYETMPSRFPDDDRVGFLCSLMVSDNSNVIVFEVPMKERSYDALTSFAMAPALTSSSFRSSMTEHLSPFAQPQSHFLQGLQNSPPDDQDDQSGMMDMSDQAESQAYILTGAQIGFDQAHIGFDEVQIGSDEAQFCFDQAQTPPHTIKQDSSNVKSQTPTQEGDKSSLLPDTEASAFAKLQSARDPTPAIDEAVSEPTYSPAAPSKQDEDTVPITAETTITTTTAETTSEPVYTPPTSNKVEEEDASIAADKATTTAVTDEKQSRKPAELRGNGKDASSKKGTDSDDDYIPGAVPKDEVVDLVSGSEDDGKPAPRRRAQIIDLSDSEGEDEGNQMEPHIQDDILNDPDSLLLSLDPTTVSTEADIASQMSESITNSKMEHLSTKDVGDALDALGLTVDTCNTWRPHQFNKLCNGKPLYVKPHQFIGSIIDLKRAVHTLANLNADEQGLGKTIQCLLTSLFRYLIGVMLRHSKANKKAHKCDKHGKCQYAACARKTWWPFVYCPCEDKCPDFIHCYGRPPTGITLVIAPFTSIWVNDFDKFFDRKFDAKYTLTPLMLYSKQTDKTKTWSYKRKANESTIKKFHFSVDDEPPEDLTRYFCITTHKSAPGLVKDLLFKHAITEWTETYRKKEVLRRSKPHVNSKLVTTAIDTVIYDECHMIKGLDTCLWRFIEFAVTASASPTTLLLLSGTPHSEGLDDLTSMIHVWRYNWTRIAKGVVDVGHNTDALKVVDNLLLNLTVDKITEWRQSAKTVASMRKKNLMKGKMDIDDIEREETRKMLQRVREFGDALIPVYRARTAETTIFNGEPLVKLPEFKPRDVTVKLSECAAEGMLTINNRVEKLVAELKEAKVNSKNLGQMFFNLQNLRPYAISPDFDKIIQEKEYAEGWTGKNPQLKKDIEAFQNNEDICFEHLLKTLWHGADRVQAMSADFNRKLGEYKQLLKSDPDTEKLPPKMLVATACPIVALSTAAMLRDQNPHWNIGLFTSNLSVPARDELGARFEESLGRDKHDEPCKVKREPLNVLIGTIHLLSVGHTFLRATVMRLMEVQNNVAYEKQFYKRAHRIGQTEVIDCVRYINLEEIPWEARISSRAAFKQLVDEAVPMKEDKESLGSPADKKREETNGQLVDDDDAYV